MENKQDLIDRYTSQMVKYLTYENAKKAKFDLTNMIEEKFPNGFEYQELKDFLNDLGSPYNFSSKYENKANMFISGKNYEIFLKFMKITGFELVISVFLYKVAIGFGNHKFVEIVNSVKILILTVFITGVLSSFISEKVKNTRMMSSLVKDFSVDELYHRPNNHINNPKQYFFLTFFSFFIFLSLIYSTLHKQEALTQILQIIYFLLILRDVNRISEVYYGKFITTLSGITDVGALVLLFSILKKYFEGTSVSLVFYLLIITIVADLFSLIKNKSQKR